ncbi:MAG: YlxR family protein [Oscillospiraceae bacterium]
MQQIKKTPLRKCTGCNQMKAKIELVRVVKNKENEIFLDLTGKKPGRGAYVCNSLECFKKARKSRGFERAFSCRISDELYDSLEKEIDKNG